MAAAILATVALARPTPRARVAMGPGETTVSGRVDVLAADAEVAVDGVARVDVEPDPGVARVTGRGGDPVGNTFLVAGGSAVAGALAAVAVLEGSAVISYGGRPGERITAGEAWSAPTAAAAAPRHDEPVADTVSDLRAQVVALQAELDQARQEADGAKLAGAIANGQLANVQGQPAVWPTDVPAALRPEAYEADVRAAVASIPGAKVTDVDCSEYPCLALVTLSTDGDVDALGPQLDGVSKSLRSGPWNGIKDLAVTVGQAVDANDDGPGGSVVLGIGAGASVSPDVLQRTKYRLDTLMTDAASAQHDAQNP